MDRRAGEGWSRKHADTQRRLCAKYLAPVIGHLACEDIKAANMQAAVDAAPTAGEGDRVRRCVSALVNVGIAGGYLPTGEPRDDSDIARAIAHILDNTQIPEGKVHAQVRAGRVTLNGEVEWQYQRLEVERMVRHVRGVVGHQQQHHRHSERQREPGASQD